MSRVVVASFLLATTLAASSCYHRPEPEFLDELRRREEAAPEVIAWVVEASVESEESSGEFRGQLVADLGSDPDDPKVRIKLFHDLGSAALDLVATPDRIDAEFPFREQSFHTALPPEERLDPSLLFLFGVTLWEHFAGLDPDRVEGVKDDGEGGTFVKLEPHPTDVRCIVHLDPEGQILERGFEYGWFVRWTLEVLEDGFRIVVPGELEFRLRIDEEVDADELPPEAFVLEPDAA